MIAGDFNTPSCVWNSRSHKRQNISVLKEFIKKFSFFINSEPGRSTGIMSEGISVIGLVLSKVELDPLTL